MYASSYYRLTDKLLGLVIHLLCVLHNKQTKSGLNKLWDGNRCGIYFSVL